MRSLAGLLLLAAVAMSGAQSAQPQLLPPLDRALPARAEAIYRVVASHVETGTAMAVVTEIAPLWRLAGNPQFDQALESIDTRLRAAGIATHFDTIRSASPGWEVRDAVLRLDSEEGEVVLSKGQDRVPLAINSFPTSASGRRLRLIDAGRGVNAKDYEGLHVAGAVVLADGPIGAVWNQAVKARGAAGVISTQTAAYTKPETTPDVLQWGSIPFDAGRASFGFKATPRGASRLRQRLAAGAVDVHVRIDAVFHRRPVRTLVAEIPGARWPDERVVLMAHVQEPGANDNASGAGTLLEVALAVQKAITDRAIPRPSRTLTMLWGDENRASEAWIAADRGRAARVLAMMSLDMTGEDTAKTGGTFLIEKSPDPAAVWASPSDPHSEWGANNVDRELLRGTYLNDLHLAVALRRARDTGWVVRTNPYQGGSDHTPFIDAGVPALLNWHFTDRYYHTNLDTIDKVNPISMGHVATIVGTTATFVASADGTDIAPLQEMLSAARDARLAVERRNAASAVALDAWTSWYQQAIASAARLSGR